MEADFELGDTQSDRLKVIGKRPFEELTAVDVEVKRAQVGKLDSLLVVVFELEVSQRLDERVVDVLQKVIQKVARSIQASAVEETARG
tara:strand:- start:123 stop:386 length:264 start_codon:yes stop_codon:yes gene_type:complete